MVELTSGRCMEEVYKVGGSGDGGLGRHDCEGSADQVVVYTGRVSDGICVEKKAREQRERHVQSHSNMDRLTRREHKRWCWWLPVGT